MYATSIKTTSQLKNFRVDYLKHTQSTGVANYIKYTDFWMQSV